MLTKGYLQAPQSKCVACPVPFILGYFIQTSLLVLINTPLPGRLLWQRQREKESEVREGTRKRGLETFSSWVPYIIMLVRHLVPLALQCVFLIFIFTSLFISLHWVLVEAQWDLRSSLQQVGSFSCGMQTH